MTASGFNAQESSCKTCIPNMTSLTRSYFQMSLIRSVSKFFVGRQGSSSSRWAAQKIAERGGIMLGLARGLKPQGGKPKRFEWSGGGSAANATRGSRKGGFKRMVLDPKNRDQDTNKRNDGTKNRNEGTKNGTTVPKTGTRVQKTPKTDLLQNHPFLYSQRINNSWRARSLRTRPHKRVTMIMVGLFTTEANNAKTHPESGFGWLLIGWALGRSLKEDRKKSVDHEYAIHVQVYKGAWEAFLGDCPAHQVPRSRPEAQLCHLI